MAADYPTDPWARKMRQAFEGERTFDTGGAAAQRAQMEALSEGFGEDREENLRIMAENYGQLTGEPVDPIDRMSEPDLDLLLAGKIDDLSEEGLDILLSLPEEQVARLRQSIGPVAPVNPPPPADVDMSDPINQLVEGVGSTPNAMPPEAEIPEQQLSPGEKFAAGGAFEAGQLGRGLKQFYYERTGNEAEAMAMEKLEEEARAQYAKIDDQGFGPEDVGEAALSLGTLLIPGANGVRALAAGTKAMKALRALSGATGTAGVNALMIGATEAAKATVGDESRLAKGGEAAAWGIGTAYGVNKLGKGVKSLFNEGFIGKAAAAAGIGTAVGASKSAVRDGIFRRFYGLLSPRKGSTRDPLETAKKVATSPQSQSMRSAAMKAELKQAESVANAGQLWATFEDVMKGPVSKTGRGQTRRGGFMNSKANKWAKENNFDTQAEAQRIGTFLMGKATLRGPKGEILFDRAKVLEGYDAIRSQEGFQKAFGRVSSTGKWTPGAAAKKLDQFMQDLRTGSGPTSAREILDYYEGKQKEAAAEVYRNLSPKKVDKLEKELADIKSRTIAVLQAEKEGQDGALWDTLNQAYEAMTTAFGEAGE